MPWRMVGTYYSPCSCNVGCPCDLGEMEGDRGWCSGVLVYEIQQGNADGTNLTGTRVVFAGDWPKGFLAGNGTARLYFDQGVNAQQQMALEDILGGKRGGVFEPIASLITNTLPSKKTSIRIQKGQNETRITVGEFGELVVKPLVGAAGEPTRLLNGAAAFRSDIILAKGTGSRWQDPEMRRWESGGHAEIAEFDWSA